MVILFSTIVKGRDFKIYETESNLLILKDNEEYDLAFMGISHARNFSRHKNHLRVEKILNEKILNIAQGNSTCGVNEQLFYLKYFYAHGVKINEIIYVLSPPLAFNENLNKSSDTFIYEPFEFDFLYKYLFFDAENKYQRLFYYIRSKISFKWLFYKPGSLDRQNGRLQKIDSVKIKNGLKLAYPNGLDIKIFTKNCEVVENTIKTAKMNNSQISFLIPPSLFGKWPGNDQVVAFCKKMHKKYNLNYYDFSESILNSKYYYDHHHLNSDGVEYFAAKYLKPLYASKVK